MVDEANVVFKGSGHWSLVLQVWLGNRQEGQRTQGVGSQESKGKGTDQIKRVQIRLGH